MTINVFGGGDSSGPVFPLQRSVRLRANNSAYFNRTLSVSSTSSTICTWSGWVKRGALGAARAVVAYSGNSAGSSNMLLIEFVSDTIRIGFDGPLTTQLQTTAVYRDPSAWYHIVVVYDSPQATASNRAKLYVNGVQVTTFTTSNYPAQNQAIAAASTNVQNIGTVSTLYFDGYIAEANFIDGQALTPASFGSINSTTGVWQPVKYSGTYGANGYYLNFQDNSNNTATTIGKDSSGNGNNFTPNGINVSAYTGTPPNNTSYDSMLDVPTLTSATNANFAVMNPLDNQATLSNGNLTQTTTTERSSRSTFAIPDSGLWYAEATVTSTTNASTIVATFGLCTASVSLSASGYNTAGIWGLYSSNFGYINRNGTPSASLGFTLTAGDIAQIAVDPANNRAWIGRNNTWYDSGTGTTGNPSGGTNPTVTSLPSGLFVFVNGLNETWNINFGQRPFTYTPPTGFKSLNTYNLPAPTIPNGAANFAATTYTGNSSTQSITNTVNGKSFQPDFVWIKGRSQVVSHRLLDSVRGVTKELYSDLTNAEATDANGLTAFGSNGFSLGTSTSYNNNTSTYVGWQWKAGGTAVTNTSGTISSQVSANPSAGFSIVTYTGTGANATVGHGLGIAPRMIIVKNRDSGAIGGAVYHASLGATKYLQLFQTTTGNASETTDNTAWNGGSPTFSSSVFSVGALNRTNSAQQMVAYCFSEIAGYSKFGSYIGNNALDGPFVYCGFIPRFILFKNSNASTDWTIFDTSRDTFNLSTKYLVPNTSGQETSGSSVQLDVLSNGFKVRGTWAGMNTSGNTIIFAAFAESPFNYSLAR